MNSKSKPLRAVILTALLVERQAVCAHLLHLRNKTHPEGNVYWSGHFPCEDCVWNVEVVEIGPGNSGAALETERAISYLKPDVTLFVGVAGGLKDVRIGDVVAATKVYSYESGKADITFQPRSEVGNSTYRMQHRARADAGNNDWLGRIKGPIPAPEPRAYLGPIAAGEKVLNSTRSIIYERLREQYSDALAIEMEGYGFLRAVHANHRVNALVIRGISDLVEGKSEADAANFQALASRHASAFAFEILSKLGSDKPFLTTIAKTRPRERTRQERQSKYSIRNSGQMAAGDNARMVINNWHNPEE